MRDLFESFFAVQTHRYVHISFFPLPKENLLKHTFFLRNELVKGQRKYNVDDLLPNDKSWADVSFILFREKKGKHVMEKNKTMTHR
jgi:hypothetical protein